MGEGVGEFGRYSFFYGDPCLFTGKELKKERGFSARGRPGMTRF